MTRLQEAGEHPVRGYRRATGSVKGHTRILASPEGNARAAALLGVLTRARSRFDVAAVARLNPDLTPRQRVLAVRQEQRYAREWERRARQRIRGRLAIDPSEETALSMIPRERSILENHLAVAGLRMTARADLAALRASGGTHGYWLRSDRPWPESCPECQARSGKLWPLDWLRQHGPPRHPNCGCKIITPAAARAWGMPIDDPEPIQEAAAPNGLQIAPMSWSLLAHATDALLTTILRIQEDARADGMSAERAERLAMLLREATVPVWREQDHPRWPEGHPLGGRFRHADIDVPDVMKPGLADLDTAARAGDAHGIDRGYERMVKAAKTLPKTDRGAALQTAARVRAAVFNPRGLRTPTGALIDAGDEQRVPVPLAIPSGGITHPWAHAADGSATFMWEVHRGELGPDHDRLVHTLRRIPQLTTTDLPGGGVRIQSAPQRNPVQATGDARRVELLAPQLTATRVQVPGVDLADTRRVDLHPDEGGSRQKTWYPGVTPRMLGDSARNLIDTTHARMTELGLTSADDPDKGPARSPMDWVIGNRGITVEAQSMRSVIPGQQQRSDTQSARMRAAKLAYVQQHDLKPSLVHALVDLDNDVAHLFLHDYPDRDTTFNEIRPPVALIDRLVAGTLRPGDDETAATGPDAGRGAKRFVFLGTFRLAYNPLLAQMDLDTARRKRGGKPPLDVGVRAPVSAPVDRVGVRQAKQQAAKQTVADREARDARIVALYNDGEGLSQNEIAAMLGVNQSTVARILRKQGAHTNEFRAPKAKPLVAPGVSSRVA